MDSICGSGGGEEEWQGVALGASKHFFVIHSKHSTRPRTHRDTDTVLNTHLFTETTRDNFTINSPHPSTMSQRMGKLNECQLPAVTTGVRGKRFQGLGGGKVGTLRQTATNFRYRLCVLKNSILLPNVHKIGTSSSKFGILKYNFPTKRTFWTG